MLSNKIEFDLFDGQTRISSKRSGRSISKVAWPSFTKDGGLMMDGVLESERLSSALRDVSGRWRYITWPSAIVKCRYRQLSDGDRLLLQAALLDQGFRKVTFE